MLAGRKLLLADDSITIHKVVDLTFADEGVTVVCVNNGREAIERLEEFVPDVVLADVFMPQLNGYEVCEYIKQNEKLKNIPVMLLVGSFEPFDEAEARRVGADDTLTKPFQSIRRLIDKVGILVGGRPAEEQIPTAELSRPVETPEPEKLSAAEIAMTTADTLPLSSELRGVVDAAAARANSDRAQFGMAGNVHERKMDNQFTQAQPLASESYEGGGDTLLDLGDYQPVSLTRSEEFELDVDLDEVQEPSPTGAGASAGSDGGWDAMPKPIEDPFATTRDLSRGVVPRPVEERSASKLTFAPTQGGRKPTSQRKTEASGSDEQALEHLSPEVIDAISRRVVEQLSERVVQEIAWEVVPQLAELLIKRQLEEKNS
ncbi:MAG: response regulator [Acidobacteriota bacterium]|nr:response regulator [Acidobacteriota bacterium]